MRGVLLGLVEIEDGSIGIGFCIGSSAVVLSQDQAYTILETLSAQLQMAGFDFDGKFDGEDDDGSDEPESNIH